MMFLSILFGLEDFKLLVGIVIIISIIVPRNPMVQVVQVSQKLSLGLIVVQIAILEHLVLLKSLPQFGLLLFFYLLNSLSIFNLFRGLLTPKSLHGIFNTHLRCDSPFLVKSIELNFSDVVSWLVENPEHETHYL